MKQPSVEPYLTTRIDSISRQASREVDDPRHRLKTDVASFVEGQYHAAIAAMRLAPPIDKPDFSRILRLQLEVDDEEAAGHPLLKLIVVTTITEIVRWLAERVVSYAVQRLTGTDPHIKVSKMNFWVDSTAPDNILSPLIVMLAKVTGHLAKRSVVVALIEMRKWYDIRRIPDSSLIEASVTEKFLASLEAFDASLSTTAQRDVQTSDEALREAARDASQPYGPMFYPFDRLVRWPRARPSPGLWKSVYKTAADVRSLVGPIRSVGASDREAVHQAMAQIAERFTTETSALLRSNIIDRHGQADAGNFHLLTGARSTCEDLAYALADVSRLPAMTVMGLDEAVKSSTRTALCRLAAVNGLRSAVLVVRDAEPAADGKVMLRVLDVFERHGRMQSNVTVAGTRLLIEIQPLVLFVAGSSAAWIEPCRALTSEHANLLQRVSMIPVQEARSSIEWTARKRLEERKQALIKSSAMPGAAASETGSTVTEPATTVLTTGTEALLERIGLGIERLLPRLLDELECCHSSSASTEEVVDRIFARSKRILADGDTPATDERLDAELMQIIASAPQELQRFSLPIPPPFRLQPDPAPEA